MGASPSQRTLKYLRDRGWPHVAVVEHWIPQARRRRDLFKFCDVLALHPEWGHLYVQVTTGSHVNARLYKMREYAAQEVEDVVLSGSRVEIHGWRQLKVGNRRLWKPRIIDVKLGELYGMEKEDWDAVYSEISEAYLMVRAYLERGIFTARSVLNNYPPSIYIDISVATGHGDDRASRFTTKERIEALELATEIAEKALAKYSWLALFTTASPDKLSLGYTLRPRSYQEAVKLLT